MLTTRMIPALASLGAILALALGGAASAGAEDPLVRLSSVAPSIQQDVRYAGHNNFIGRRIRGYESATILISREAAAALALAQTAAEAEGLSLLVFDAYRPQRAVDDFVAWASDPSDTRMQATFYPDVPKAELFERGYIAARSGHSRGSTVDLTLTRNGVPLDMGTPFDFFGERSHTEHPSVRDTALENRFLLRRIMEAAGFENYAQEWWHYTLRDEPYPDTYFDVPVRE
jgi:D-alanyl-D-alanine dipeptidase